MEEEMSDTFVAQWLEQSTGNRKTSARMPAQSKVSFFPQKDFQILYIFEFICNICDIRVRNCLQGHLSTTYPI